MLLYVTLGNVLGLFFWTFMDFTGNPGQSQVLLMMKQDHQSFVYASKSLDADRCIFLFYIQGQVQEWTPTSTQS